LKYGDALAGYITLLSDKLEVDLQLLEEEGVRYRTFPAIKIGLLAADSRVKGVGKILVEWALEYAAFELASIVGVRFITVDALYDPDEDPCRTMYFDLKPIIDLSLSENFS
jgi:hypothetical protein